MSSMIRSYARAALVVALVSEPCLDRRAQAQSDETAPQPAAADAAGGVVSQLAAQARALAAKGRMDQAAEVWLKVLRSRPDHTEALEGLGLWHANAGRTQKAREQLAQLEKVAPASPGAQRLRAALSVGKDFEALVNQARAQVKAGKLTAAIAAYERAFGGAAPPERLALEYYQTLGGTEAGWEPARKGLADYASTHPDNSNAQLALALHLTYREASRRDGIERLRVLAKQDTLRVQAQSSWHKALLWLQASPADAPRYRAYLDEVGADHDVSARLGQLTSAVTVVQRGNTVQAGFAALERSDTAEATQQFERAGDLPEALVGLGLVALHDEDFELAVKLLDKASQRAPTRGDLWEKPLRSARFWERVKRAQKLMAANDHAAAENLLREALRLSPEESYHARIALAELLRKTDRVALAEQELQAALASKPGDPNVLRALVDVKLARNDLEGALESNTQLVAIDPARAWPQAELSAEVMRRRAAEQRAHGELEAAHKLLVQAAERAPKLYWVQHDLVSIELELGALDPARGRLGGLIDLDPNEPAGRVLRARIENELGRPENALELLRGLQPEAAGGQVGVLQRELGLRRDVARLVRSSPRLGAFGARRELLKLQRNAGGEPSLLAIVALGFADVGESDRAVQLMQDAIASRPTADSGMSLQLAAIYLRAGRDAELRELIEELASDPSLTPRARRDLSKLHVAFAVANADRLATTGDYTRALSQLEPLLTEYPDDAGLLCGLGRLFVASGDYPDAAATFERVLAYDPNNLEAREGAVSVAQLRRDRTRAGHLVDEGLSRLPNRARMHLIAARFQLSENDDAAAMRELARARELAEKGERGAAAPQLAAALVPTEAAGLVARARARLAAEEVLPVIEGRALIDAIELEIDRIGQRHRVSISAEPAMRYRAGEVGLGRLLELRAPLTIGVPLGYFGKVEVGVTAVVLSAGKAALDNVDSASRFGSLGSVAGMAARRTQDDSGFAPHAAFNYRDILRLQVGSTPLGFVYQSVVGSLALRGQWGDFSAKLHGEREAVTDSLLSYAGTTDPLSGATFGGVTAQGGGLELGYGDSQTFVYLTGGFHLLTGHEVDDNIRATVGGGSSFTLYDWDGQRVQLGATVYGAHYDKNLSGFTLGHGGYFSPQWFVRGGVPLEWRLTSDKLGVRVLVDPGVNWFRRKDSPYYPRSSQLQAAREELGETGVYQGGDVFGFSLNLDGELRYQVVPSFALGLTGSMHFARDYEEYRAGVLVELSFGPKVRSASVKEPR